MTDIVERLRNRALATEIIKGNPSLYNDAADVIISLCAENEKLRNALAAKRERCAKIAERYLSNNEPVRLTASSIAAAIRESGDE